MGNGNAEIVAFRNAAAQGRIGVDPDAAHSVLNKIRASKDAVETLITRSHDLGVPPKLGANPVGYSIATKYAQRADGGGESYADALRNLYHQYEQAEQGIVNAMRHYQQYDQDAAETFNGQA